jgi:hypothetical protein
MKVQCACGAKYVFEVSPEMLEKPLRFVCTSCGLDASDYVNSLVRQELGVDSAAETAVVAGAASNQSAEDAESQSLPTGPLRVRVHAPQPTKVEAAPASAESDTCSKHYGVRTVAKCYVCSKPICPKCMALFGYVCSPLCKAKADSHGINVPVYEGQKSRVQARYWRNIGHAVVATCVLAVVLVGLWVWYLFWGCLPKPVFSVRFPEMAYSGQSDFAGKDQIVFLHGDTLARYDLKQKKEIWSRRLVDKKQIEATVAEEKKWYQATIDEANNEGRAKVPKMPSSETLTSRAEKAAAAQLVLRVRGENIWVSSAGKLIRYDWDTGNPGKEVSVGYAGLIPSQGEFLTVNTDSGQAVITHINLTNCETRTEDLAGQPIPVNLASKTTAPTLPPGLQPGSGALDPAKIAEQAQHLSYAARIALPAVLATKLNQERAMNEMTENPPRPKTPAPATTTEPDETSSLVPTKDGLMQVSVRLLESRIIYRSAMKAPPKKSALDGDVTASQSTEIANEILNDLQRSRGGDTVAEDESRYQVKLRRPGDRDGWTGEVVGPPTFFPLQTVNVLAFNKGILVFDKNNKLMWKGLLNYSVIGDPGSLDAANAPYGQGPIVEHKNSLYVFDEGVLTAFDLKSGNARWRLPSVGIAGIFFDDHDMMYVNTTTVGPDSLKYSRQIDVSQKTSSVVLKLDSKTGKTIWSAEPNGLVNYVSGKYIFVVKMYQPYEPDDEEEALIQGEEHQTPPYLRIKRINPDTGVEMWEHFEQRSPLDIQFEKNTIRLVFRKEVEVLKFLSL